MPRNFFMAVKDRESEQRNFSPAGDCRRGKCFLIYPNSHEIHCCYVDMSRAPGLALLTLGAVSCVRKTKFQVAETNMPNILKRVAARFPRQIQHELRRYYYSWQIRRGKFSTLEREFQILESFVEAGDWAIDVGANVGHYTARLSKLVGPTGRVLAFEPVPRTFELLTANARQFPHANVTLMNVALSDSPALAAMEVPGVEGGAYLAHLTERDTGLSVLCLPFDAISLPRPVRLVKIDAEGHELSVLRGMTKLLTRDRPALIVEVSHAETAGFLQGLGYVTEKLPGSPNCIFRCPSSRELAA
jgi:FkbM family methyltransferase